MLRVNFGITLGNDCFSKKRWLLRDTMADVEEKEEMEMEMRKEKRGGWKWTKEEGDEERGGNWR